jgi:hypothetical protein
MTRQIKIARDTVREGCTSAIVTLKALIVTRPAELREQLEGLTDKVLIERCANLPPERSRLPPRQPNTPSVHWRSAGSSSIRSR